MPNGFQAFIAGGFIILGGGISEWFVWLANPVYLAALILFFRSKKLNRIFAVAALLLALSFTTFKEILVSEDGRIAKIQTLNMGYWLWVVSIAILATGAFCYLMRAPKNTPNA
jgi:uncharacterized membrane protein